MSLRVTLNVDWTAFAVLLMIIVSDIFFFCFLSTLSKLIQIKPGKTIQ